MKNKDKYYVYYIDENGNEKIVFRSPLLIVVNAILRIVQPFNVNTERYLLLCVESDIDDDGNAHFVRYKFRRMKFYDRTYFENASSFIRDYFLYRKMKKVQKEEMK